ncbi:TPA: hypothetical protein ON538_000189 [Morganella morganii]|uniref:hypothetical protein n=1 Tax=Morganella morganii TaxID=582 RepID=UPI0028070DC4|nr:hypothetical protein [Morganella morganii]HCR3334100.1 hypothetical protein [Morganella morganii]
MADGMVRDMNKLTGKLLLTFALPLTAVAAPPAAVMMRHRILTGKIHLLLPVRNITGR